MFVVDADRGGNVREVFEGGTFRDVKRRRRARRSTPRTRRSRRGRRNDSLARETKVLSKLWARGTENRQGWSKGDV